MWEAVGQVSSWISLIGLAVAAIAEVLRRYLLSRERLARATPPRDRAAITMALSDSFLIPATPVDTAALTPDQRYQLLLEQIHDRARRFYVFTATVVVIVIAAGIFAAIGFTTRSASRVRSEDAAGAEPKRDESVVTLDRTAFLVRLMSTVGDDNFKTVADKLKIEGYRVQIVKDASDPATRTNTPVMAIGSKVPPQIAAPVIRAVHRDMPWVQYVFVQHDDRVQYELQPNVHVDWIDYLGLKRLNDSDFARLESPPETMSSFHALIDSFKR